MKPARSILLLATAATLLLNIAPHAADGLETWSFIEPRNGNGTFGRITFGAGRWIANGLTSTNGLNWTGMNVSPDFGLGTFAYGNGRWLAAGSSSPAPDCNRGNPTCKGLFGSTDGIHWTHELNFCTASITDRNSRFIFGHSCLRTFRLPDRADNRSQGRTLSMKKRKTNFPRSATPLLAVCCFALLCADTAVLRAATITVTSLADSGPGTLRAALASAGDGDTIDFAVTGALTLTSGQLMISNDVKILGPGPAVLAIDGNGRDRVFQVLPSNTVGIAGLTIRNGNAASRAGGGILNDHGHLTIDNCVVHGNAATNLGVGGGIFSDGQHGLATLHIANSIVTGNSADNRGGGIFNFFGILTISNCTIANNSAGLVGYGGGGGIFSGAINSLGSATLRIVNSTLSGNSAGRGQGGGIYSDGEFGHARAELVNCTVSGNSAGDGGGIFNSGFVGEADLRIVNSTLTGNSVVGGAGTSIYNYGISGSALLAIGSSILEAGPSGGNIFNYFGSITSLGYNLSSDSGVTNYPASSGSLTGPGDQVNADPMLGPLQDNGGPTFSHAFRCLSPAIDKGKNLAASDSDQRGFSRTFDHPAVPNALAGDGTDIGAVEARDPLPGCSAAEEVQALIDLLEGATLPRRSIRPLIATLKAAVAAVERNDLTRGVHLLQLFQKKAQVQVAPVDAELAQQLIDAARDIIDGLEG